MNSLMIAGTRPGPPHVPVRNRNGTSIRSKKITNSARSWAISAPSTPLSARPNQKKNSPGRSHSVNEAQTALARNSTVASRIRNRFSPSIPSL